jgi:glutamine kinase
VPVMHSLAGLPYVDLRAVFNSFVPKALPTELAEKLVSYYLAQLESKPENHDKVEFEIVFSCYSFRTAEKLFALKEHGFSETELGNLGKALRGLTNQLLSAGFPRLRTDLAKVRLLRERGHAIQQSEISDLDKARALLRDCRRFGTLPFCGLARSAFVGVQLMGSLVEAGAISEDDRAGFMASLGTITRSMNEDLLRAFQGEGEKALFLERYGHLRPGTYDICSLRYDEAFSFYFPGPPALACEIPVFQLPESATKAVGLLLERAGITCSPEQLLMFIRESIRARESSKFHFSRNLSDALKALARAGERLGIGREDLAFLDIHALMRLPSGVGDSQLRHFFTEQIQMGRESFSLSGSLRLPQLVFSPQDVYGFHLADSEPNFISLARALGETLLERDFPSGSLRGKIVLLERADPGYDWIFSKGISGLITKFGGANSHIAIRAAELGLPAVIGCGELKFEGWRRAKALELDCANRVVRVIR